MTTLARHAEIIKHALGMNGHRRQDWGTRNHFSTYESSVDYPHLQAMERLGLVERVPGLASTSGAHHFRATDKGVAAIGFERSFKGYLRPLA
jgi:hypothetical protein